MTTGFDEDLWAADQAEWTRATGAVNPFPIDNPDHEVWERLEAEAQERVRRAREDDASEEDDDRAVEEERRWPVLPNDAHYGLAGEVVATLDPHTEADPAAVLFTFLSAAGCYFGPEPHVLGGNTRHPGKVWPILTGSTSAGAKGTALAATFQVVESIDLIFAQSNRAAGLSTSEGLIRRVRDRAGSDPNAAGFDEGVADKRIIINEPEFASVLGRARREGNTLSATLRDAYDGVPLQTLVSHNPLIATGHHVAIIAAITPHELTEKLTATDVANGLANRFMIVCSRRSKLLPDGGNPPRSELSALASRFRAALKQVHGVKRMARTEAATKLWHDEYHHRFSTQPTEGPLAAMCARWHAHSARMSVIYALLDGRCEIDATHVRAGLAAWEYVEQSIRYVFGGADFDRELGRLVEFVNASEFGKTRKDISIELFQRHKTAAELDVLLGKLVDLGRYEAVRLSTAGRPKLVYVRKGRPAVAP